MLNVVDCSLHAADSYCVSINFSLLPPMEVLYLQPWGVNPTGTGAAVQQLLEDAKQAVSNVILVGAGTAEALLGHVNAFVVSHGPLLLHRLSPTPLVKKWVSWPSLAWYLLLSWYLRLLSAMEVSSLSMHIDAAASTLLLLGPGRSKCTP